MISACGDFPRPIGSICWRRRSSGIGNSSNAFLILQTKGIGASLTTTILIYAGFNLVAALISYPAGFLSDRFGRRVLLLLAMAIFFVTYLGFALTQHVVVIGVLFLFYGLFQGIFRSVGKALAGDYVSESLHASAIGWYSTTIGVFGLVASVVAGWLWTTPDTDPCFCSAPSRRLQAPSRCSP